MITSVDEREVEIQAVVDRVKALTSGEVTRDTLALVAREIERLAQREEFFSRSEFPPPEGQTNVLYTLSCDPDGRYALYLSSANAGKETPPHNHATWAVIVGIDGEELNRIYERTDDGSVAGRAALRVAREHTVRPGAPIALLPDDIHSIHVHGDRATFHLHIYGRRLQDLTDRLQFDLQTGEYKHFPPNPNIR